MTGATDSSETRKLDVTTENSKTETVWPRFADVPEPRMVCLYTGNGSGTKLYQSFLDGHPEIYMVPAYPLLYLYPHWGQWEEELADDWTWRSIIVAFCIKHATIIDTRRILSFDGMTRLGQDKDQHIAIDEDLFRAHLAHLLDGEPITARTFVLAVHYTYAFCRGEDLGRKTVLVYHIHVPDYVPRYLIPDFPDMLILATVRSPCANFRGRHTSNTVADFTRLNRSDAILYQQRAHHYSLRYFLEGLDVVAGFPLDRIRVIRHEDLFHNLAGTMKATADFIGIQHHPCLSELTFGGLLWWGDKVYDMMPMNTVNPRVVSLDWQKRIGKIDWYVYEGVMYRYMKKFDYTAFKYKNDTVLNRLVLCLAILVPLRTEREEFWKFIRPAAQLDFLRACLDEATGATPFKDYSFNAFYRHKWTHRDLGLWRARWYVERVADARRSAGEKPRSLFRTGRLLLAQTIYVGVGLVRFWRTVLGYPLMIAKNRRLLYAAFRRMTKQKNVLPDSL